MEQILKGWLIKSPPEPKTGGHWKLFGAKWKRRFFVLYAPPLGSGITDYRGAMLEYYTSTKMNTKVGFINLDDCDEILSELDSDTYKHVFGLQTKHKGKDRTYYLVSETEDEMNRWVNHLCRVLGLLENDECKPMPPSARPPLTPSSNLGMNKRINSEPNLIENTHSCFVSPTGKSSISYAEMAHEERLKQAGSVPDFDAHSSVFHHQDLPPPRAHPNLPPIPPHKSRKSCDILPDLPTTLSDLPPPKPPKYKINNKAKSASINLFDGDNDGKNNRVDKDDNHNEVCDDNSDNNKVDNNKNDIVSSISKNWVKKSTSSSASTIKAYDDNDDDDVSDDDVDEDDDGEYKISSPANGHKDRGNDKDVKFNYNNNKNNNHNNNEITEFYDAPPNNNNNNKTNNNEEQEFYDIPVNINTTNNNIKTTINNNNNTTTNNNTNTTTNNYNNTTTTDEKKNNNNKSVNEKDDFYDVPAQKHNNNNNNNNNNNIIDDNNNNQSQDLYDTPNNVNKNDVNNNNINNINNITLGGGSPMVTKPKVAKRTKKPKKESDNNNHNNNNEVSFDNNKIKKDSAEVENVFDETNKDGEELYVYDVPLKMTTNNITNKLHITSRKAESHDCSIEQPTKQKQPLKPPQLPQPLPQKPLQPQQQQLEDNVNSIPSQTILKPVRHKRNQLNSNETTATPPKVAIKPKPSNSIPTICSPQPPQLPLKPELSHDIPEQNLNEQSQQPEPQSTKKPYQFGSKHTKLINTASFGAAEGKVPTVKQSFSQLIKNEIRFTQRSRSFRRSLTSNERPKVKLPIKKFEKEESSSVSSSPSSSDDDEDDDDSH